MAAAAAERAGGLQAPALAKEEGAEGQQRQQRLLLGRFASETQLARQREGVALGAAFLPCGEGAQKPAAGVEAPGEAAAARC